MVHVRVNGQSHDLEERVLDLRGNASEREIRDAVARHLDINRDQLDVLVLDRTPGGDLLLRPVAVFG
jgi:hypothetical protein